MRGNQGCDTPLCENRDVNPESWCTRCCQFLCNECTRLHRPDCREGSEGPCESFISMDSPHALERLKISQLRQRCTEHSKAFEHFCLECEKPRCSGFNTCFNSRHELEDLESNEASCYTAELWQEVDRFCELANGKATLLQQHVELQNAVLNSRESHVLRLKAAKKQVLAAVQKADTTCKETVHEFYDRLEAKAKSISDAATRLHRAVEQTRSYSRLLLREGDIAALLDQRSVVLSRLHSLTADLQSMRSASAPENLVSHELAPPAEHTDVATGWFGTPKLLTENFFCLEDDLLPKSCIVPAIGELRFGCVDTRENLLL